MSRGTDVRRFHEILAEMRTKVGERRLRDCDGKIPWPSRGVYFFFEEGEARTSSGPGPRVVRVGTHALAARSSTTLWNRLSQHRGAVSSSGGNHRGSIFRLLVGEALLRRQGLTCSSWGLKQDLSSAAVHLGLPREAVKEQEAAIERQVSQVIGAMPFTWLPIGDPPGPASERGYVERNAIALLSNAGKEPIDGPSAGWLGRFSGRQPVRSSGLWNNNHVGEPYDPAFLDRMATSLR